MFYIYTFAHRDTNIRIYTRTLIYIDIKRERERERGEQDLYINEYICRRYFLSYIPRAFNKSAFNLNFILLSKNTYSIKEIKSNK